MRSSSYEYEIEIYGYSYNTNDYGERESVYALKYSEYAAKSQVNGREDVEGDENQQVYTRREVWTIRDAGQNITTLDRLKHGDDFYNIINVEIINNRIIEITTEYRDNSSE
jgi:hypothetical protein